MSRRNFLRMSLGGLSIIATHSFALIGMASEASSPTSKSDALAAKLAVVLRLIGTEHSLKAATKIETSITSRSVLQFHVRGGAGIDSSGAQMIARVLRSMSTKNTHVLDSFSLSYNKAIGDMGAVALAHALPGSLRELGLVGCGIGDKGGQALLQWARHAPGLRMVCIENNNFSPALRAQFDQLRQMRADLYVSA